MLGSVLLVRAQLSPPAAGAVGGSILERTLFRLMDVPGGPVMARRVPAESVPGLTALLAKSPRRSELYAVRAQEEERALNFSAAQADWRRSADTAGERVPALIALADYYARRLEHKREITELLEAGRLPSRGMDRFRPASKQQAWMLFGRALDAANRADLPREERRAIYEAWIARYPKATEPYRDSLDSAIAGKDQGEAQASVERIRKAFPDDAELQIESEAKLAGLQGNGQAELTVYAQHFTPLWPAELRDAYYRQLKNRHELRTFLADARSEAGANPTALAPVLKTFFYYEQAGDRERADAELSALAARRAAAHFAWSTSDWLTAAPLYQRVTDYDGCARAYYSVYEQTGANSADRETALAGLISLLLDVPEQPLQLGRRDLSLYRNAATMDPHPGFLNGILSLALNSTFPQYQFQSASQTAVAYFHRAAAVRFLEVYRQSFPNSVQTGTLEAKLYGAYAAYGQNDALIRLMPDWLRRNPNVDDFVSTALLLADAYANTARTNDEFALYTLLLGQLAAKSDHLPLGPDALAGPGQPVQVRSADYALVLDRYIGRLTQERRLTDALALYRKEIDRNPDDPGLYSRLALFVEQNRLDAELAQTYQQAFARFNDASWGAKLARLYLRRKQYGAYAQLTRKVTDTFSGSELAAFLPRVEPDSRMNGALYRQVNLYAHQRFPHELAFVRNLLAVYRAGGGADAAAYDKLLRESWFYDAGLRAEFFEYLTRTGKLEHELAGLPALGAAAGQRNAAAIAMEAEGEAWLTHYERSAPAFVRMAGLAPGDRVGNRRAIEVERSLAGYEAGVPTAKAAAFGTAIRLAQQDAQAAPSDLEALTRVGEIYADRELFQRAAPWWEWVAKAEPGEANGYLESATVFWDYFRYAAALGQIGEARKTLGEPARFAYEAGAIYESRGDYSQAIREYLAAALERPASGSSGLAERRLMTLGARKATATYVAEQMGALLDGPFRWEAIALDVALLEKEDRRQDIRVLLDAQLPHAGSLDEVEEIRRACERFGFDDLTIRTLERSIALTTDPVEKLAARTKLAVFRETHGDPAAAERELSALLAEDPAVVGVIRANVDFYWREKRPRRAVETLTQAAARAVAPYRNELLQEAAQKASDSGDYAQARTRLDELLVGDPYNADLLARKAATFARAGDAPGLVKFYSDEMKVLEQSGLAADDKRDRVGGLRRGYIQALISSQQPAAALEQYQQLIDQFPEDNGLVREAARFAEANRLADRLVGYYTKATADSPRDYRWPLVLARVEERLGRYLEALVAYGKAAYVRPDRLDILGSKADLETRLLRFEEALATEAKLYEASYHDAQYLAAQAALQARLQHPAEALRLLRAAYIDPHPRDPGGYLEVMRQLAGWKMFEAVDGVYQELLPVMPKDDSRSNEAIRLEGSALVSLHRPDGAVKAVTAAFQKLNTRDEALAGSEISEQIGATAALYLMPDEKQKLAGLLDVPDQLSAPFRRSEFAKAAGLEAAASKALEDRLKREPEQVWTNLVQLQNSRLEFEQLGNALSAAGLRASENLRDELLRAALEAYRMAGDDANQLRLSEALSRVRAQVVPDEQFASIFLRAGGDVPRRIAGLAKSNPQKADAVMTYAFSHSAQAEVRDAIQARSGQMGPSWSAAYSGLAGLFFLAPDGWVDQSFAALRGPASVGAELASLRASAAGAPSAAPLRGAEWFYYASRYGDYLAYLKRAGGEDLLPAQLESAPVASNSYVGVGDGYADREQFSRALALYRDALELSPERADVHDRMAVTQMRAGQKGTAIDEWRTVFRLLAKRVEAGPLPPEYWSTAQNALRHANDWDEAASLRPEIDGMVRAYAARNGGYNVEPLVEGMLSHAPDSERAVGWVLELARQTKTGALAEAALRSESVPASAKDSIYRYEIARFEAALGAASGEAAQGTREQLRQARVEYARYLIAQDRAGYAWQTLREIQPETERPKGLVLQGGVRAGHLPELLQDYRARPETAPSGDEIMAIASGLGKDRAGAALSLREFEYERELDSDFSPVSAYFGLAQVRIDQTRASEALELLQRVTVSVGAPFENLPEAVRFLEGAGLRAEAERYAEEWSKAEPWNSEAQLATARLKGDAALLNAVRESPRAVYGTRVAAAAELRRLRSVSPGIDELSLLTRPALTAAEAEKPFFVAARVLAAQSTQDAGERVRLYREGIRMDPSLRAERLSLADAAFAAGRPVLAIAALESYHANPTGSSDTTLLNRVREQAAQVLTKRGEFGQASALYSEMLAGADPVEAKRVRGLRDAVLAQDRLSALNQARQPIVSEALQQPRVVRPKLARLPARGSFE